MSPAFWQDIAGPISGAGIGLRSNHFNQVLHEQPSVPWFEALTDNYLLQGGPMLKRLLAAREHYPINLHGVALSLGSTDPLDRGYLDKLERLIQQLQPQWVSEHLCWTSANGVHLHELMPLPYTEEAVAHLADRIRQVQDRLQRRILVENVSSYMSYSYSAMSEAEFYKAVVEEADCMMLLDVNNVYVSARNHDFDANEYLSMMPAERVVEIHLGGFEDQGTHLLDTHGAAPCDAVWDLYAQTIARIGERPTLIEWDNNIPAFDVLQQQAIRAQRILNDHAQAA